MADQERPGGGEDGSRKPNPKPGRWLGSEYSGRSL